jgi:RluA family pseudouridine synthase
VLFEDEWLIAFDKPAGLLTVPDRWDKTRGNLMQTVHETLSPAWFNVHRLDRETSGVLLCAKTRPVLQRLAGRFQSGNIGKIYLALTRGTPPDERGEILLPLAADPRRRGRVCVRRKEGRPARTTYEILERWRDCAMVRMELHTGRTHQIRVHLAAVGAPVLCDSFYGDGRPLLLSDIKPGYKRKDAPERPLLSRLALHAERLAFAHPETNENTVIVSPLPREFEIALKYLRRFGG